MKLFLSFQTFEFLSQVWGVTEEATETKEGEKETFRKDLKNEKVFSQCKYNYIIVQMVISWWYWHELHTLCTRQSLTYSIDIIIDFIFTCSGFDSKITKKFFTQSSYSLINFFLGFFSCLSSFHNSNILVLMIQIPDYLYCF